jgi:hypothetical protein
MAVGKRLRFQIFRRDNFACRYCGITAQAGAVLEVDHVKPRAEGGKDEPTNLVTACEDCNNGKSDIPLNAPVVEDVPQDALRALLATRAAEAGEAPSRDVELADWVQDLEIGAAVAWHQGFNDELPGWRKSGTHRVEFAIAVAVGCDGQSIEDASYRAGLQQDPHLLSYLTVPTSEEEPHEQEAYREAVEFLKGFVPSEQIRLIWRARAAADDYWPTVPELVRAAEHQARLYVEEEGRDEDELSRWLDGLPGNEGSRWRVQASADWDAHWSGKRGHSAHECPSEVLELAISLALGAEVPCV